MDVKSSPSPSCWQAEPDKDLLIIVGSDHCRWCRVLEERFGDIFNSPHNPFQTVWVYLKKEQVVPAVPWAKICGVEWRIRDGDLQSEPVGNWERLLDPRTVTSSPPPRDHAYLAGVPCIVRIRRSILLKEKAGFNDIRIAITEFLRNPVQPFTNKNGIWAAIGDWAIVGRIIEWMEIIGQFPIRCGENLFSPLYLCVDDLYRLNPPTSPATDLDPWMKSDAKLAKPSADHLDIDPRSLGPLLSVDVSWKGHRARLLALRPIIATLATNKRWMTLIGERYDAVDEALKHILAPFLLRDLIAMVSACLEPRWSPTIPQASPSLATPQKQETDKRQSD